MSAFEYERRVRMDARDAAEDPAVLLLELATVLVDVGTALTKVAKALHAEREPELARVLVLPRDGSGVHVPEPGNYLVVLEPPVAVT